MQERSLLALDPRCALIAGECLRICGSKGVPVLVYETRRSRERQQAMWDQGRDGKAGAIVTHARPGESYHNYGMAFDAVPLFQEQGGNRLDWRPFPDAAAEARFRTTGALTHLDRDWAVLVAAAESVGLEWAGRWSGFREYVHFQLRDEDVDAMILDAKAARTA